MGLMNAVIAASRAASDAARWSDMLTALCRRFDATAACLHTPRSATPDRALFVDHGLPTHTVPDYVEYWSPRDPWMAGALQKDICVRTGECGIGRELCDWDTLYTLDYFHEFAAPTGVKGLLAMIVDDGSRPAAAPFTVIGLYRRPGLEEFSHQDKRVFESVHAPLQLALHAHWALGRGRDAASYDTLYGQRSAVSSIEIEKLSCTYDGVAESLQYRWRTNNGVDYGYIYAPGRGWCRCSRTRAGAELAQMSMAL
ncbi:hypothetical protein A9977_30800 [Variovorax sp. UMC13]|nr:hypothetical protein [Variovorax sp. UMC13]